MNAQLFGSPVLSTFHNVSPRSVQVFLNEDNVVEVHAEVDGPGEA